MKLSYAAQGALDQLIWALCGDPPEEGEGPVWEAHIEREQKLHDMVLGAVEAWIKAEPVETEEGQRAPIMSSVFRGRDGVRQLGSPRSTEP
jgi:hypothetical protein